MQANGLIYSLVSRGHQTILSSYSAYGGNFPSYAIDVLSSLFRYYINATCLKLLGNMEPLIIFFLHLQKRDSYFW